MDERSYTDYSFLRDLSPDALILLEVLGEVVKIGYKFNVETHTLEDCVILKFKKLFGG